MYNTVRFSLIALYIFISLLCKSEYFFNNNKKKRSCQEEKLIDPPFFFLQTFRTGNKSNRGRTYIFSLSFSQPANTLTFDSCEPPPTDHFSTPTYLLHFLCRNILSATPPPPSTASPFGAEDTVFSDSFQRSVRHLQ